MEFLRWFIKGCLKGLRPSLLVETLSPLSPSPYQGEGEDDSLKRGFAPLRHPAIEVRELKRGFASLTQPPPPLLFRRGG